MKKNKKQPPKTFDIHRNLPEVSRLKNSQSGQPTKPQQVEAARKKRGWKFALISVLLILFISSIFVATWDARNISKASQKMFGSGDIFTLLSGGSLKTDDKGRVNILVAGYSLDDPGHQGANLTDSIMLLSMNPNNDTGYMLSIPRDLFVRIPGSGSGKINEVYKDGGMPLLAQIVEDDFGVPIGYWALVNYASVRDSVTALGGIKVTINSPDGRLYDPNRDWSTNGPLVDLSNGTHNLNGQQALDLTRARGDYPNPYGTPIGFEQSDFQRSIDQRLVFTAIKDKLSWKVVLNPRQNSQILNAFADNITTNIQASEARPLFGTFNSIPSSKLQSLSLRDLNGKNYLVSTYYEGSTLSPAAGTYDFSQIQQAISQL